MVFLHYSAFTAISFIVLRNKGMVSRQENGVSCLKVKLRTVVDSGIISNDVIPDISCEHWKQGSSLIHPGGVVARI